MKKTEIEKYINLPPEERDFSLLLRDVLFSDIFSSDKSKILYYYGKEIANNFEFSQIEDILNFFSEIGFGKINLVKVKKNAYLFEFLGNQVDKRFYVDKKPEFSLETGFLAQAISLVINCPAEGQFKINRNKKLISVLIQTIPNKKT